jgi:hypothetical protein
LLFTAPGERLNRPSFGSGLMQLVFALTATPWRQPRWRCTGTAGLGEAVLIEAVTCDEDAVLHVTVRYAIRRTQERRVAELVRSV